MGILLSRVVAVAALDSKAPQPTCLPPTPDTLEELLGGLPDILQLQDIRLPPLPGTELHPNLATELHPSQATEHHLNRAMEHPHSLVMGHPLSLDMEHRPNRDMEPLHNQAMGHLISNPNMGPRNQVRFS